MPFVSLLYFSNRVCIICYLSYNALTLECVHIVKYVKGALCSTFYSYFLTMPQPEIVSWISNIYVSNVRMTFNFDSINRG